nr:NADPH-dependent glutamate synthase [Candidatus Hecatella orcuttiae]
MKKVAKPDKLIPKQAMPKLSMEERRKTLKEVALGFSEDLALVEASRCLQCAKPKCVEGCPVNIDIPAFIKLIQERKFEEAIEKIKERNALPAMCGRVCPQENLCQKSCVLGIKGEPVAIGALERFAADYELKKEPITPTGSKCNPTGVKVAVVGSGPFGLTAAADLAKQGFDVTIFEALHEPGGVLIYGIPEFRLPKRVVKAEVEYVKSLGVKIQTDVIIGKTYTLDELFQMGYKAVFIGTGAGAPIFLGIPGENLSGIYSANEFLTRVNLMKAYLFPKYATPVKVGRKVAVIGGGNVAFDSARTALRLGAEKVALVYRRTEAEMPARREEVENAKEEGVEFMCLVNPVRFIGDEAGWVKEMECLRMELGEPDESGRRRPIPIKGSEFRIPVDTVIVAIGTRVNPLIQKTAPLLKTDKHGHLVVDDYGRTSMKFVYAGGDITSGTATVIEAMKAGKRTVQAFCEDLQKSE